jgi:hypothetical protein
MTKIPRIMVGDLKKALKDLPDDLIVIYSHDDEGNEYQRVISLPTVVYMKKSSDYRFLEIETELPNEHQKKYEKAVCLN